MATFLTGNELNSELGNIFEEASSVIILISPFIKLHERYISILKTKKDRPDLEVIIVFGKNQDDFSKSMKEEDFNFFKEFPNIEIKYEKRLHAKYYANESTAILTSMNLYDYSQDNNIEAGVMTKHNLLSKLGVVVVEGSLDNEAESYFSRVIEQSELLFKRSPQYDKKILGLTKKFTGSKIIVDKLSDFFADRIKLGLPKYKGSLEQNKSERAEGSGGIIAGYCIRTGKQIPFDIKHPMTEEAYKNWAKFKNREFREKYCHFSGEESLGETTYAKPILSKNWKKAQEIHGF